MDFKKENLDQFYELKGVLGEGGFGKVYEAEMKTKRGCRRAIKTIEKKKFRQFRALQNEIKILTRADDPSIIKIYETFDNQDHYHIVME